MTHYCAIACCVSSSLALDQIPGRGLAAGAYRHPKRSEMPAFGSNPEDAASALCLLLPGTDIGIGLAVVPRHARGDQSAMSESIRPGITARPAKSMTWVLGRGSQVSFPQLQTKRTSALWQRSANWRPEQVQQ